MTDEFPRLEYTLTGLDGAQLQYRKLYGTFESGVWEFRFVLKPDPDTVAPPAVFGVEYVIFRTMQPGIDLRLPDECSIVQAGLTDAIRFEPNILVARAFLPAFTLNDEWLGIRLRAI